ncbi:MAG: hypothetical protein EBT03_11790 [Betaproteobacteria bacterium]|nr:hypothetical protein [Betaproteobacteria bacterium]
MSNDLLRSLVREVIEELTEKESPSSREDTGDGDGEVGRPRKDPKNRLAHWLDTHDDGVKKIKRATSRTRATIDKWARNEVTPTLNVAKQIEDMTNIPMDYWAES